MLFLRMIFLLWRAPSATFIDLIGFDKVGKLLHCEKLDELPINMTIRAVAKMNRIQSSLGENWEVSSVGRFHLGTEKFKFPRSPSRPMIYEIVDGTVPVNDFLTIEPHNSRCVGLRAARAADTHTFECL